MLSGDCTLGQRDCSWVFKLFRWGSQVDITDGTGKCALDASATRWSKSGGT